MGGLAARAEPPSVHAARWPVEPTGPLPSIVREYMRNRAGRSQHDGVPLGTKLESARTYARASVWFWPLVATVLAVVLALALLHVRPDPSSWPARLAWPADASTATVLLQVIAMAAITAISLTLSLAVVALQLASQQFSPRLLREFARDWTTQAVMAVLSSTFVFALTVLRGLHRPGAQPSVAIGLAYLLALLSIAALVTFLAHIVRALRVDTMMITVHGNTERAIRSFYPAAGADGNAGPAPELSRRDDSHPVLAARSGFVRRVSADALVAAAAKHDVCITLETRPGDEVTIATPLATVYPSGARGKADRREVDGTLDAAVRRAVLVSYERTLEQDVAFGFRQLADIAVKSLSPAINDPATAAHAINHMSDLSIKLLGRHLGPATHRDAGGVARVVLPGRDLRYYLDLACGQNPPLWAP